MILGLSLFAGGCSNDQIVQEYNPAKYPTAKVQNEVLRKSHRLFSFQKG